MIGGAGEDTINASVSNFDRGVLRSNRLDIIGGDLDITARGFEVINVSAGVDAGRLAIFDSAGNDQITAGFDAVAIAGDGFQHSAAGFSLVTVNATRGGNDVVELVGTGADERFLSDGDRNVLRSGTDRIVATGFRNVSVDGGGGEDFATVRDSVGSDRYTLSGNEFTLEANEYVVQGQGFERINAIASAGYDIVVFEGSEASESLIHRTDRTRFSGDGFLNVATGFEQINVNAAGDNDTARIFDSAGDDTFFAIGRFAEYRGGGQVLFATGFTQVDVVAGAGGSDTATLTGSAGADQVLGTANSATLIDGGGARYRVTDFADVSIDTGGGLDLSNLVGSEGGDLLSTLEDGIRVQTSLQNLEVLNAEENRFEGRGGLDEVLFSDFDSLDLLEGLGDGATAYLNNREIEVAGIELLRAIADSDDPVNYDIEAVDYLFLLDGNWQQRENS